MIDEKEIRDIVEHLPQQLQTKLFAVDEKENEEVSELITFARRCGYEFEYFFDEFTEVNQIRIDNHSPLHWIAKNYLFKWQEYGTTIICSNPYSIQYQEKDTTITIKIACHNSLWSYQIDTQLPSTNFQSMITLESCTIRSYDEAYRQARLEATTIAIQFNLQKINDELQQETEIF